MPWIETIAVPAAGGRLKTLYGRVKGPDGRVDNILALHSLRPHTMEGHMALYKATLHHSGNALPEWFLETLGVWVSALNGCAYCVEHHFAGLRRLLRDDARADALRRAIEARDLQAAPLDDRQRRALRYAEALTLTPTAVTRADVEGLRAAGFSDGEILEINQVTAYFAYANRTVLGLGCSTEGDVLGLSPGNLDNPDDWSHG
jgi:uncharacterized peroxidase-related enzyme